MRRRRVALAMQRWQHRAYTVKERRLTLGRQYRVFAPDGAMVAYCKQKMFRLKEDIRFFADESQQQEVLHLRATKVLDFNANFEVVDPFDGRVIGFLRRKGWRSLLRDKWMAYDAQERLVCELSEDSWVVAILLRRWLLSFWPHHYVARRQEDQGDVLAEIKERWQIFGDTYDLTIHHDIDPRLLLGLTILVDAMEAE